MSSSSVPKKRLQQLAGHIAKPLEGDDLGSFEGIPKIAHIAPDSREPRLKDKVTIITGCNSPLGIGRATAHQFAAQGARAIYICDLASAHLETHKRELAALYPGVEVYVRTFDAADEDAVRGVINEAVDAYGRLDVFYANAGVLGTPKAFGDIGPDAFMRTLRNNVLSVFLAAKHSAPAMQLTSPSKPTPSGSILMTASVAGLRSNAGSTDYSASKAAVVSLAQTLAFQLAGTNVRANAICPGLVETGMTAATYAAARARGTAGKIGQLNPMRRGAVADEIARVAAFLAGDEASYVNGQAWAVDGGLSAGHPVVPGKLA